MTTVPQNPDLLTEARANSPAALETMFRQFIDDNEELIHARFLGRRGVFGFGPQCFAAVTDRRVASIQYSKFGEVVYQDGFLNKITSSVVYQPSLLWLIIMRVLVAILAIPTLGLALLLGPGIASLFYKLQKSGVLFYVGDGIPVFLFCDRKLIRYANELQRTVMELAGQSENQKRSIQPRVATATQTAPEIRHAKSSMWPQTAGSKRVRVSDEGLTRWCNRFFMIAWLSALVAAGSAYLEAHWRRTAWDYAGHHEQDTLNSYAGFHKGDLPVRSYISTFYSPQTDSPTVAEDYEWAEETSESEYGEEMAMYYHYLAQWAGFCGLVTVVVAGVSLLSAIVTFVWWFGRRCNQVPTPFRRLDGATARVLLSIPVVNLIGTFFTLPKLADSYDAAVDALVEETPPPSAYGIGVAICIVTLLPFVNLAVNPFLIRIYLRRIEAIRSEITGSQTA